MFNLKNIQQLKEVTEDLSILYIEDDKSVSIPVSEILNKFFKKLIIAKDGLEGLELYAQNMDSIDFIISDINMPNMNGLDMVKQIRQQNNDIPIIISTAYNEQEYFLKSIELKIDKYLLKPLKKEKLLEIIYDISKSLKERKLLKQLLEDKRKVELKEKEMQTIATISDAYASPAVIFHDGHATHFSNPFKELFKDRKDVSLSEVTIDSKELFKKQKGSLASFADYDNLNELNNKVIIPQKVGHKVFRVQKKSIHLEEDSEIFTLIDITMEEYQKIKIDSFAEALTDMVINHKSIDILKESNDKQTSMNLEISTEENARGLFRKNHKKNQISSKEFLLNVDEEDLQSLQELDDLDKDLSEVLYCIDDGEFDKFIKIASIIGKYADTIYLFEDFTDLYIVIKDLSNLLASINFETIDESKYNTFIMYLNSIREDLSAWRKNVFIEQNAIDIHYLDSSLINTSLEIEILLSSKIDDTSYYEDNDSLEFF